MAKQKEVFKEIWDEREHKCQVCGKKIYTAKAINFAHILGKGAYPAFKFFKRNIWIMCSFHHTRWDFGHKSDPKFEELREEEQRLKEMYNQKDSFKVWR